MTLSRRSEWFDTLLGAEDVVSVVAVAAGGGAVRRSSRPEVLPGPTVVGLLVSSTGIRL